MHFQILIMLIKHEFIVNNCLFVPNHQKFNQLFFIYKYVIYMSDDMSISIMHD